MLSTSLVDSILNGYQQSKEVAVQIVNPLDYDFGEPPEEVLTHFSMQCCVVMFVDPTYPQLGHTCPMIRIVGLPQLW